MTIEYRDRLRARATITPLDMVEDSLGYYDNRLRTELAVGLVEIMEKLGPEDFLVVRSLTRNTHPYYTLDGEEIGVTVNWEMSYSVNRVPFKSEL